MRNKFLLMAAFLAPLFLISGMAPAGNAGISSLEAAVNTAGRQRMLTQRIARSYVQIGISADAQTAWSNMRDSIRLFEWQYFELRRVSPSADVWQALNQVEMSWPAFKRLALQQPTKAGAERLVDMDTRLLEQSERVVSLLEQASASEIGRLVNISGRQRMLSQRLAKNYMLLAAGLGGQSAAEEILRDKDAFRTALDTLQASPENTDKINEQLGSVAEQWRWLDSALNVQDESYYPLVVADASEKILRLMESLTDAYARIGH